jgi:hypothetical protein
MPARPKDYPLLPLADRFFNVKNTSQKDNGLFKIAHP